MSNDTVSTGNSDPATEEKKPSSMFALNGRSMFAGLGASMAIRYKLMIALGVLTVLTIISAGTGVFSLSSIRSDFDELAQKRIAAVADGSKLAVQSNKIATAAVEISKAQDEFDRSSAFCDLKKVVETIKSSTDTVLKENPNSSEANDLLSSVSALESSLIQLDDSTRARLAAATRRTENLEELFREHAEISRAFVPIIDDAYFDAALAGEKIGQFENPNAVEEMGDHLAKLKSALEADSALHQLVALMVNGALTYDENSIIPLQDRINALAARFEKSITTVGDANLSAKLFVITAFADPKTGLLADRRDELDAAGKSKAIIDEMFFLTNQLSSSIDSMIATQRQQAQESAGQVHKLIATSQSMMIAVGVVSLAIALIIAIFVVHRGLTLRLERLITNMQTLAEGDIETDFPASKSNDEIGDMARAVEVFRENARERSRLASVSEKEQLEREKRQQRVEELVSEFRDAIGEVLESVSGNVGEMQTTAQLLTGIAEDTTSKASGATGASQEAYSSVQNVATATEELSTSIAEITRQVEDAASVVGEAGDNVKSTTERVSSLATAADKIGDIVTMIQDIAEQTNLLALNATIEAARAGDAGKGFAVVASEVKTLANQTAKATEEISSQISEIQSSTGDAVTAIQAISKTMDTISKYTASINTSVEQQNAATGEINASVHQAATSARSVSDNMDGLSASVSETTQSAAQVEHASTSVAEQADQLRKTVDDFLEKVAAA
ncbi:MAG: methyl-accepting chemotaxis protein [Pseudomonadota bacterium]